MQIPKSIIARLGLASDATRAQCITALADKSRAARELKRELKLKQAELLAAKERHDQDRFKLDAINTEIERLRSETSKREQDGIVKLAMDSGKVLPGSSATLNYLREMAEADPEAAQKHVQAMRQLAPLGRTLQSRSVVNKRTGEYGLSDQQTKIATLLGLTPAQWCRHNRLEDE